MLSRLKFDIQGLFEEIYNERLPESIFASDKTTFVDLQSAGLQSIIPLVNKLREYGHSDDNIRSRVFAFMENDVYFNYVMVKFSDLPVTFDIYKESIDMKFDVVVGNPPYQQKVGDRKTEPLWNKFVLKSFNIVKEGGYVSLVHPSGWRSSKGKFKNIQELILGENLVYLSMNDFNEGSKVFGVGTNFDYYVVQKSDKYIQTIISDVDGNQTTVNVKGMEFIPNGMFEKFNDIIAKDGEEKVNVLYSRSQYGTDKTNMSKIMTQNNIYPCVYTITQKDGVNLYYSDDRGDIHFDVPKVIWSNGLGTYPIIDEDGVYGLTQFSYGIVDNVKNLENIKIAMESEEFIKLMTYVKYTNNKYDYKIISTFKKDFWKQFINE